MKLSKLVLLLVYFPLVSCAYSVHQNSISDFLDTPSSSAKKIIADSQQQVIFANFSNFSLVEEALHDLESQCPKGTITGISTEYMTALGFFSWKEHIRLVGTCRPQT